MSSIDQAVETRQIKPGSPRSFGFVFTVVFGLIGLWPLIFGGEQPAWLAVVVAFVFLVISLVRPSLLAPLNNLWFRLGLLLARVVNPIVMSIIFVVTVVPTGLIMRLLGKQPLQLDVASEKTMWQEVDGDDSSRSFKNQF